MIRTDEWRNAILGGELVFGLLLFIAPWLVGFAGDPAASWTAWLSGALIGVLAIAALSWQAQAAQWAQWAMLVLGVWAVLAPWLVGFSGVSGAMWTHLVLGVLTVLAAAGELWVEHQSPPGVHA